MEGKIVEEVVEGMTLEDKISVNMSWKAENFEGEKAAEVDGGMKSKDEINIEDVAEKFVRGQAKRRQRKRDHEQPSSIDQTEAQCQTRR